MMFWGTSDRCGNEDFLKKERGKGMQQERQGTNGTNDRATNWTTSREMNPATKKYGILVISHGSREADWVRLVDEAVAQVNKPEDVPVYSSCLEIVEGRLIQDGIDFLEAQGVTDLIVVPLFTSSGSVHVDEIRYALGVQNEPALATDLPRMCVSAKVHWTSVLDDHPLIVDALWDKLRQLSAEPAKEVVMVIGHGSKEDGFYEKWRSGLEKVAGKLQEKGGFAAVEAALLLPDEVAEVAGRLKVQYPEHELLVSPFFISEGYFTRKVIPQRLVGYDYKYNGLTLLPHDNVSGWIEEQIGKVLQPG